VPVLSPPGQGLRGSSDIHAFGDSNLYLRRAKEHLMLSTEHRAAPASPPVYLALVTTNPETIHLEVIAQQRDGKQRSLQEQVLDVLAGGQVLTRDQVVNLSVGWHIRYATAMNRPALDTSQRAIPLLLDMR
jgi:hypothetical protein